jgi:hypothetical protein
MAKIAAMAFCIALLYSTTPLAHPDVTISYSVGILHGIRQGAETEMAETLQVFQQPVEAPDGRLFEARACGGPMAGGNWHGWIEFIPIGGGDPVRSPRETTQPNRVDLEYWATGLTLVYLEGALRRALAEPTVVPTTPPQPSVFDGPAPRAARVAANVDAVLDPFSVYEKGEALLRQQLAAFSAWHLVNIIEAYELSDEPADVLNRLPAIELIEMIVSEVRTRRELATPR